ncbi:MAG: cyclohexadienyl dehydratase [Candidatus Azotimanducaceae bacterium]
MSIVKTEVLRGQYRVLLSQRRWLLGLLVLASCHVAASEPRALDQLINARLSHMKDVAAYKWLHGLPIEDLAREKTVIRAARQTGLQSGLTIKSSRWFFTAQIEAAKEIQRYWFTEWQQTGAPQTAPDLGTEIRPKLIALGNQIVTALAAPPRRAEFSLHAEGLTDETAAKLVVATLAIEFYANQLEQVIQSKTLRVGTTLDYAPFSYETETQPLGIDLDLAADLAKALGAELVIFKTSWPTLMADLHEGKFDIGMSGISINLERQKTALFSLPHHSGGKTPISRCEDIEKFDSLAKIDQPNTRLVVNPGGTNQQFVLANITQADHRVHDDNRTIFNEIIRGKADLMITDAIEVRLQSALHPELCATMPEQTLTFQQKAFLLPQDPIWKAFVDTWLGQRTGEGEVDKAFRRHLAE